MDFEEAVRKAIREYRSGKGYEMSGKVAEENEKDGFKYTNEYFDQMEKDFFGNDAAEVEDEDDSDEEYEESE